VAGVAEIQSESSTVVRQWESGGGVSFPDGDNRLGINERNRSERGLHLTAAKLLTITSYVKTTERSKGPKSFDS
jgi:hypothetical protein